MSAARKKSVGMRIVKFFLRSDQPSFVAAAAGVSLALGTLISFFIIIMHFYSTRPSPLWEVIAAGLFGGLLFGLMFMPFFFMTISRAILFMSPWEALATITAVSLCPLIMWGLGAREGLGVNPFLVIVGCIALVAAAFLTARVIEKRHRSSL